MFENLRKINIKTAVFMGICFYSLSVLIHILIISGIIPLSWVNGGRSDSIATQLPISIVNSVISIIGGTLTLIVGANRLYKFNREISIILWLFVIFWSFGFIQQLFGTPFEKIVCSLLLLLGVISNLRMAIEKR
ncbi:hypothetical protein [Metabacillus litoralis]|uniref:hypothetical protein n=1 Tax=Metabacillus litoralis TaxID=152268 RepID=UPI001CFCB1D5|nr:hypothetical protein [Metabacillus litoralis]